MPTKCECSGDMEAVAHDDYVDFICEDCGTIVGGEAIVEGEEPTEEVGEVDEV